MTNSSVRCATTAIFGGVIILISPYTNKIELEASMSLLNGPEVAYGGIIQLQFKPLLDVQAAGAGGSGISSGGETPD